MNPEWPRGFFSSIFECPLRISLVEFLSLVHAYFFPVVTNKFTPAAAEQRSSFLKVAGQVAGMHRNLVIGWRAEDHIFREGNQKGPFEDRN
jgi:hypothetical protein